MQPHLRPMDAGEILDGAFRLYRRHPRAFALAGALPVLPLLAVWVWLAGRAWSGAPPGPAHADALLALAVLGGWVPATLTRAVVARMTDDAQMGRPVGPGAAWRRTLRRLPAALLASGVTSLLAALPLFAGLAMLAALAGGGWAAGYWLTAALMWLTPAALAAPWFGVPAAVALEGAGGHGARLRSWRLTRAAPATVGTVWCATVLLQWMSWAAAGALLVATDAGRASGWQGVVWLAVCQAANAVTVPLVAAARTLLFNDLRVRAEALDVRIATERLAPA